MSRRRANPSGSDCLAVDFDITTRVLRPAYDGNALLAVQAAAGEALRDWNLHRQSRGRGPQRWAPQRAFAKVLWETLYVRGVLPQAWLGDAARSFHDEDTGKNFAVPVDIYTAATMGADVPGEARAEALLREANERLRRLTREGKPVRAVAWRVVRNTQRSEGPADDRALELALRTEGLAASWASPASTLAEDLLGMRRAEVLRRAAAAYQAFADAEPRAAPNPFAPLVEVVCLGYVPYGIGTARPELHAHYAPMERR